MFRYYGKNIRPFSAVCDNSYGRKVIKTNESVITAGNIVKELNKAIPIHEQNVREINYLDGYYRGDQPILYRVKEVRPEINNKIVENVAYMIVETKVAEMAGEPIQYNQCGTDESKSEQIAELNQLMDGEDKQYYDVELCRWRSICGTAYRFVGNNEDHGQLLDETSFCFHIEDPRNTFVVYHQDGNPAFSCQVRTDENNETVYNIYSNRQYFCVKKGIIIDIDKNGNGAIPVIEYPNNERRISDIEITISMTDELSKMASDRANGVEQFIASYIKFVNCEIDSDTYQKMRQEGALVVKSNNGSDNKADVDVITSELNQTETQVAVSDLYEKILVIQGIANRQTANGSDTGNAVSLRNGWFEQEQRAQICEPIFKRAEKQTLRIILNRLRIERGFTLGISDIEIKIPRDKADNIQVKAQALQTLLSCGIENARAIKTCGLFSDPERVAVESKDRMEILYPTEQPQPVVNPLESTLTNADEDVEEKNLNGNDTAL